MYNKHKDANQKQLERLIKKEGYIDLGWANNGANIQPSSNSRFRELDLSLYADEGTHKVYIDDEHKQILHVDLSD